MRKLLFLLSAFPFFASAQSIVIDETRNGERLILTDKTVCRSFSDEMVLNVSLLAVINEEKKDTTILLCTKIATMGKTSADSNAPMLLKLTDDTIMELTSMPFFEDSWLKLTVVGKTLIITNDLNLAFPVTQEQIKKISDLGVKKVRIAMQPNMYDKEFKKDKVGEAVRKHWRFLRAAMRVPHKTTSIYEGF